MPTCRNCHKEISSFDKDVCPYCGTPHPIDDNYHTRDMTGFVDPVTGNYKLYKSKSKKQAGLLCLLAGYTGAHFFYLEKVKYGIISLVATIILVAGLGSALFFTCWKSPLAFLVPFFADWLFYIGLSFFYFFKDSIKDGNGEFLR